MQSLYSAAPADWAIKGEIFIESIIFVIKIDWERNKKQQKLTGFCVLADGILNGTLSKFSEGICCMYHGVGRFGSPLRKFRPLGKGGGGR